MIKPGLYRHFKGKEYEVLDLAENSETREQMVVYRALYGEFGLWVRPASMWEETVERDGKTYQRFTYIGEPTLSVRSEQPGDFFGAELMTKRAFWNLHRPGCDEHYLLHLLRADKCYVPELSRVAVADGKVVGGIYYAMASVEKDGESLPVLTFGPLCVDPEYQGRGVGGRLLEETLSAAREMGFGGAIIFGEPGYYPRHGFVTCDKFGITTAKGENLDAFMCIELHKGGLANLSGGRFHDPAVYENLDPAAVDEFDKAFPHMEKLKLPGNGRKKNTISHMMRQSRQIRGCRFFVIPIFHFRKFCRKQTER